MHADDMELVREFAASGSDAAFAMLVQRYVNLVYSAALRRLGNAQEAEEVAQAVFIILAQKAGSLRKGTILSGWLYQTAQLTAANFHRAAVRRQRREQEAFMQFSGQSEPDVSSRRFGPLLEEAMARLNSKERDAVVLHFFDNCTVREVAAALGLREDAAQKRVNRATDKLRGYFVRRGVQVSTAALLASIGTQALQAAPAGLASKIAATAALKGAAGSASTLTLIKSTLKIMAWTKAKTVGAAVAAVILAGGTSIVAVKTIHSLPPSKNKMMPLVEDFFRHNFRDVTSRETFEWGETATTPDGNISIRYKYRANIWNGDTVTNNQIFTFNRQGKFVSVIDTKYVNLPEIDSTAVRTYAVGKKVSEFPAVEDMSTPEAAYAVFNRALAVGDQAIWARLSIQSKARMFPSNAKPVKVLPSKAHKMLEATVIEVDVYREAYAMVFAQMEGEVDIRVLRFEGGRWLNVGNDFADSLEKARQFFRSRSRRYDADQSWSEAMQR